MNFVTYSVIDWNNELKSKSDQTIPKALSYPMQSMQSMQSRPSDLSSVRLLSVPNTIVCPLGFATVLELLFEIYPESISKQLAQQFSQEIIPNLNQNDNDLVFESYNLITFVHNINIDKSKFDFVAQITQFEDTVKFANQINNFITSKTKGLIQGQVESSDLNAMITIINVIYFMGVWQYGFNPRDTFQSAWNNDPSKQILYMTLSKKSLPFYADDNFKCLELPYKNNNFVFGIMLAQSKTIDQLGAKVIVSTINKVKPINKVEKVQIPKFTIRYTVPSAQITEAFQLKPFTRCIQELYIRIDEQGTEAASVTTLQTLGHSLDPKNEFIANRPFVYYIKYVPTNSIIFVGRIDQF